MKTVAIVQARVSSTRLPRKVLREIAGRTMLEHVVERLSMAHGIDTVVVATSDSSDDDELVEFCTALGIPCVRGPLHDVLARFLVAVDHTHADRVVRVTSDCPLADPALIDEVIAAFAATGADYAANRLVEERAYPIGLDVEVVSADALRRAAAEASRDFEREHVTPYLYAGDNGFHVEFVGEPHLAALQRWTVDTPEDLEFVRAVFEHLDGSTNWLDVLSVLDNHPELSKINAGVAQKSLYTAQKQDEQDA